LELWLLASIAVILAWGLWGFALKYASLSLEWYHVYVASALGAILVYTAFTLAMIASGRLPLGANSKSLAVAVLGGFLGALGGLLLALALRLGEASIIVPLTSVYPAVTVLLSALLLGEDITVKKALGIALAVAAVVILSTSD